MISIPRIFGRLGNSLFQYAFLYAYSRDNDIDFYYQDPQFFFGHEEEIRQLFSMGIPKKTDMIAIHLRRGDYVNNPFYVDLSSTDYYERAMKEFPHEKFLVFSDDIEYAKTYFVGNEFEFAEGTPEEDMDLMASCKGIIISNSSYSWWGAFLGDKNKKVIAPKVWYSDGVERTKCLESWKRI